MNIPSQDLISNLTSSFHFQVNGRDVSQSTHEEAMEAFLQAQEPITVEVLRRNPVSSSSNPSSTTNTQSTRGGNNNSACSSKRNSCYFPTENIANSIAIQTEVILGGIELPTSSPTRDDLLLPFLDYEVIISFNTLAFSSNKKET